MKKMKNKNIAIFGSNSHIAKGLIFYYLQEKGYYLHLFSQHPDKVRKFLNSMSKETKPRYFVHSGYRNIMKYSYDMIISCVGAGTLNKHKGDYTKYFTVTEKFDNLALAYLKEISGKTKYICFSSGAIYGGKCSSPAKDNTLNYINVNHVAPSEYYSIVRLNSEAKHRAFKNLNIIDLRVFSYFSRFADLRDGYFITDLMNCILRKKVLLTDRNNIIRDFVHPKDLFMAIKKCESKKMINAAFDISSSKPISKKSGIVLCLVQWIR